MKLTDYDYEQIASKMTTERCITKYHKNGEILAIEYDCDVTGSVEDDYNNGTGAFIPSMAKCVIGDHESYTTKGDITETELDDAKLASLVEKNEMQC